MPHQKARHFAKFIMNSNESKMQNALKSAAQRIKNRGINPRASFMVGFSSLASDIKTRNAYSRDGKTEVSMRKDDKSIMLMDGRRASQNPVHTSYNAWPYG